MAFAYSFPPMRESILKNGLRALWLPDHEQEIVDCMVQIPFGRIHDPAGAEGTGDLMVSLMLKGPRSCAHERYIDALEQVGASQTADVGEEHTTLSIRALYRHARDSVSHFWNMLCEPAFNESEFKQVKREMMTSLQAEYADPPALAAKHFQAELYGANSPLGRVASLKTLRRLTAADMRRHYERMVSPSGSMAVFAADTGIEAMEGLWQPVIEGWRGTTGVGAQPIQCEAPCIQSTRIRLVDKPDTSQTTLIIGHPAVPERHKAKIPLALGNYILGGGNFSSRLMAEIRTRTGKTYGIASQLSANRDSGLFLISTTTQNAQVRDVVAAVIEVYRSVVENGVTEQELEKAKQFALGNLAFQLEGIGNVAEKLLWLRFFGYENSHIEKFGDMLSEIDIVSVNHALKNVLASPGFVIAAVGKRKEIEPQLQEFGEIHAVNFRAQP